MNKLALALLFVGASTIAAAQSTTETEALGTGSPSSSCKYSGACTASVLDSNGAPDGTIQVYPSQKILHRYDLAGNLLWSSTDYNPGPCCTGTYGGSFTTTDGAISGTLNFTLGQKQVYVGGGGRWAYYQTWSWVQSGTLTTTPQAP